MAGETDTDTGSITAPPRSRSGQQRLPSPASSSSTMANLQAHQQAAQSSPLATTSLPADPTHGNVFAAQQQQQQPSTSAQTSAPAAPATASAASRARRPSPMNIDDTAPDAGNESTASTCE